MEKLEGANSYFRNRKSNIDLLWVLMYFWWKHESLNKQNKQNILLILQIKHWTSNMKLMKHLAFPKGKRGRQLKRGTPAYYVVTLLPKLHENEENWTGRGGPLGQNFAAYAVVLWYKAEEIVRSICCNPFFKGIQGKTFAFGEWN